MFNFSTDMNRKRWVEQEAPSQFGRLSSTENENSADEDIEESKSSVQPGEQFRNDLHRALESTHRQHAAQRTLGIRQAYTEPSVWHHPLIMFPTLVLTIAAIFYIWCYRNGLKK